MKKIYIKGRPGYMKHRKISLGIASLTGFLLMLLVFVTGYIITGSPKNYITIVAVLIVLPTTKIFVQYLVVPWKNNVEQEEYDRLKTAIAPIPLYCELMITGSEKNYEVLYLIIDKDENIIAYTRNEKADEGAFEKAIVNFLNYYNYDAKVKLYKDFKQYEKRAKALALRNADNTKEQQEHIEEVFEKLSIMSV